MSFSYSSFYKLPPLRSEEKTARKMKDVSIKRHKPALKARAKKAEKAGSKRFDAELRKMQKRANERMRQLELQGIKSPSYKAVQAKLEILGKRTKDDRGRRFSETGRATYNEAEMQKRILREFLEADTSTIKGAKNYYDRVWQSAQENDKNGIKAAGISRDQWFEFWENMPDNKKDRMFYSQQVKIFTSFMRKNGDLVDEGKITIEEIADSIQEANELNEVFSNLNELYVEALDKGKKPDADGFIFIGDLKGVFD